MDTAPDVTVAAVTESGGRFLIVEECIEQRLLLNQPAGHVERGETLLEAVMREAREETAWRFHPQALLGIYRWRNPSNARWILRFAFVGSVSDHDAQQPLDRGILRTHWLDSEELATRRRQLRSPLVLRCVHDYLVGARAPLEPTAMLDRDKAALIRPGVVIV
jgi:8-oxo-dGTP pyrophosphatase MutT (NUDIX family)